MTTPYTEPELNKAAFNCPFCNAYAKFLWGDVEARLYGSRKSVEYKAAQCSHCEKWTLWTSEEDVSVSDELVYKGSLIYPFKLTSPLAHKDLPEACKSEYEEARNVFPFSTRAAAALLRLCIQKLCKELGEEGENINKDIGELVKKGMDTRIQKALDIVRVTGNNSVHPGEMNVKDDEKLVEKLFKFINVIVEEMITKPKEIKELYDEKLPEGSKKAIEERDS